MYLTLYDNGKMYNINVYIKLKLAPRIIILSFSSSPESSRFVTVYIVRNQIKRFAII